MKAETVAAGWRPRTEIIMVNQRIVIPSFLFRMKLAFQQWARLLTLDLLNDIPLVEGFPEKIFLKRIYALSRSSIPVSTLFH
jgi:hypothetical protein